VSTETTLLSNKRQGAQLVLPLPQRPPRFDRDAFLIAPTNDAAWRAGQAWLASEEPSLIICGPEGSGKTHLATILSSDDGVFFDWREATTSVPGEAKVIVLDALPADDPKRFLSVIEDLTNAGRRLILAGRGHPGEWAMGLKDLRTRLEAIPRANLDQPDEALLRAVLTKGFSDRQVNIDAAVVEYAAPRLPRTFAAAREFVEVADAEAARRKKKITIALAKEVIDAAEQSGVKALRDETAEISE